MFNKIIVLLLVANLKDLMQNMQMGWLLLYSNDTGLIITVAKHNGVNSSQL